MKSSKMQGMDGRYYGGQVYLGPPPTTDVSEDSTLGAVLAVMLCVNLFCTIIACIAYPFTMCKDMLSPPLHHLVDTWL